MTVASFLKQLIGVVEEMEAAIGSEDVTCAVSIIRGQGQHTSKFRKLPWKQIARNPNSDVWFKNVDVL